MEVAAVVAVVALKAEAEKVVVRLAAAVVKAMATAGPVAPASRRAAVEAMHRQVVAARNNIPRLRLT